MTNYFITGLPRSRTAWLSNLLTYGNSFCWHDIRYIEGSSIPAPLEQIKKRLALSGFEKIGASDPAIISCWEWLRDSYPNAKWVVIERDSGESLLSSEAAFGPINENAFALLAFSFKRMCNSVPHLHVKFEDLDSAVYDIARHVGVDIGNEERVQQLQRFQIRVRPELFPK